MVFWSPLDVLMIAKWILMITYHWDIWLCLIITCGKLNLPRVVKLSEWLYTSYPASILEQCSWSRAWICHDCAAHAIKKIRHIIRAAFHNLKQTGSKYKGSVCFLGTSLIWQIWSLYFIINIPVSLLGFSSFVIGITFTVIISDSASKAQLSNNEFISINLHTS